ncbi:MAG: lamin tail domain-containing protein [Sandaracinaceae bacterium]|nr:MAG: lamin tail domain-containing protein [Sandaracinaceae bacterium]
MKSWRAWAIGAALSGLLIACDGGDDPEDAGTDAQVSADAEPPMDADTGDDGGIDPDGGPDDGGVDMDGGPGDAGDMDGAVGDAGPDDAGMTDAGPPGGGAATSAQILAVREAAVGTIMLPIDDAVVTYVKPSFGSEADDEGFFVQAEMAGPALFVQTSLAALTPTPEVGQVVDFRAVSRAEAAGAIEYVDMIDMWNVDSSGHDVRFLAQDVSSVDLVTDVDDYAYELITLTADVVGDFSFAGSNHSGGELTTAGVPTPASELVFRLPDAVREVTSLGVGCTVEIGPTPLWRFAATAQPSAWDIADFTLSSCQAPTTGDLVITELGFSFTGGDAGKELIEIYNPDADHAFSLDGCRLADASGVGDASAVSIGAVFVGPMDHVVIAGPLATSGVAPDAPVGSLALDAMDVVTLACGCSGATCTDTVDTVDYSSAGFTDAMVDATMQLDRLDLEAFDPAMANDDLANWCVTSTASPYGSFTPARYGTPGQINEVCPLTCAAFAPHIVINEIDYDDMGADDKEFVELYNPTTAAIDLSTLAVVFYNGSNSREYRRVPLLGSLAAGGYLVVTTSDTVGITPTDPSYTITGGIQNGSPDGVGILDTTTDTLIDFITYEGSFTGGTMLSDSGGTPYTSIPAPHNLSIGADTDSPDVQSLIRILDGCDTGAPDMDWTATTVVTPGAANSL